MHKQNPLLPLHEALSAALLRDLRDIQYETTDWAAAHQLRETLPAADYAARQRERTLPVKTMTRRPSADAVDVILFPQTWGSTALGYGGVGGAAMSEAYTIIVSTGGEACVYFGGGALAYRVDFTKMSVKERRAWEAALSSRNMPGRMEALPLFGGIA
jgi:hypothetical protein